jgi:hypothetical protein
MSRQNYADPDPQHCTPLMNHKYQSNIFFNQTMHRKKNKLHPKVNVSEMSRPFYETRKRQVSRDTGPLFCSEMSSSERVSAWGWKAVKGKGAYTSRPVIVFILYNSQPIGSWQNKNRSHPQLEIEIRHVSTRVPGHGFPAWRVADYGGLSTCIIERQLEIPSARCWAPPVRETGMIRKRQAVRPSNMYKSTPAGSLSPRQSGGPLCWASPLTFGLIG